MAMDMTTKRLRLEVSGIVQGVGFRPFVKRLANRGHLAGWARNSGGSLELEIQGIADECLRFIREISKQAPSGSRVHAIDIKEITTENEPGAFTILDSRTKSELHPFIPVDIGICDKCRQELLDATDRRFAYPFTNCCACGPRYTIIKKLPYDRERTSMRTFHMCLDCGFEYSDQSDRRFHAQPNACWECGPQHTYIDRHTMVTGRMAIDKAVASLGAGGIIAIKGVGGFHLVCLATDAAGVAKLRSLKSRPDKPLAVMVSDLDQAAGLAELGTAEAELMAGADRPIVLLKRLSSDLAPNISSGLNTVGVMFPYAPVHVLLLKELTKPLVMTSANFKGQPIIIDNNDAARRLKDIIDAGLYHDRRIVNGCDDSVVRRSAGRTLIIRAGRGRSPGSLRLSGDYRPILACGADLKSSICLADRGWAHISQYLGDLADVDCFDRYRSSVKMISDLLGVRPEIVASDLHPDYVSSAYASSLALPVKRVQHHHAHIAAVLAEKGINKPVIGVAFDGSGWGDDGHIWGGEWFICDRRDAKRSARFKEVPMPGGEASVHHPWRMALSYLVELGLGETEITALLKYVPAGEVGSVLRQIKSGVNVPLTSSCGRLFEAAASLILSCQGQSYEGQAATRLESAISAGENGIYEFKYEEGDGVITVDQSPAIEALIADKAAGVSQAIMAARFHNGLAEAVCLVSERLRWMSGIDVVALGGGVFVNAYLLDKVTAGLSSRGFEVVFNEEVPINDGGISFGQAAVVAAGGGK